MLHGLLWFPLLAFFIWIAWAGWNDYQKIETYRLWATGFQHTKYDLYSAIRADTTTLTWGIPHRQSITNLQSLALSDIAEVALQLNGTLIKPDQNKAQAVQLKKVKSVALVVKTTAESFVIPFTELHLATQWAEWLQSLRHSPDLS
jgi:hypothetical protein